MAITTISTKNTEQEAREEMEKHNGSNLRRCTGYGESAERFWFYDYAHGLVLAAYEQNGYDDSDFYALVWNEEKQEIEHVRYATTRGWSYPCNAWIDATPEVIEKARESRRPAIKSMFYSNAEKKAKEIQKGKTVKVVRGRKVPKGTEGEVFWYGSTAFGYSVGIMYDVLNDEGIAIGRERVFTSAKNVEVVGWELLMPSAEQIEKDVDYCVRTANFRSLTY